MLAISTNASKSCCENRLMVKNNVITSTLLTRLRIFSTLDTPQWITCTRFFIPASNNLSLSSDTALLLGSTQYTFLTFLHLEISPPWPVPMSNTVHPFAYVFNIFLFTALWYCRMRTEA